LHGVRFRRKNIVFMLKSLFRSECITFPLHFPLHVLSTNATSISVTNTVIGLD